MNRLKPDSVFLVLALVFGTVTLLANPPFEAPDECEHFFRIFQLSEGTLVGQRQGGDAGGVLPTAIFKVAATHEIAGHSAVKMKWAFFVEALNPPFLDWSNPGPRSFVGFRHGVCYPPVGYLPQALGVAIGRLAHIGPLGLMYLARLAGFIASVLLGYAALRCLPIFRWTMMILLLCPMSLYLMGSPAPDGILISSAFLLFALLVRLASDPNHRVGFGEKAAVIALVCVPSMAKLVYLPFGAVALVFMLPRLPSRREQLGFLAAGVVFCIVPIWLWSRGVAHLYVPARDDIKVDAVAQLHYVVRAPLDFLSLMARTLRDSHVGLYWWFVGMLGWGDTPMPQWYYGSFGTVILLSAVLESPRARCISWIQRAALAGAFAAVVVLTFVIMYAVCNPLRSGADIDGVQGRYFLPIAPLAVLSFPAFPRLRIPGCVPAVVGSLWGLTSAATCVYAVVVRYYVP